MPNPEPAPLGQDDLHEILQAALTRLFAEEMDILAADVSERTICAALAPMLRPSFPHHRVHAEYNRRGIEPKQVRMPDADGNLTLNRVFPDLIVHQPGHDRENLLIIEVKKTTNRDPDDADLAKLDQMRQQIGYRFAVFLRISAGPNCTLQDCRIRWV